MVHSTDFFPQMHSLQSPQTVIEFVSLQSLSCPPLNLSDLEETLAQPPNQIQAFDPSSLRNLKHYLLPFFSSISPQGLWLELELMYTGCLQMTLETKMNLCKLGKDGENEAHSLTETQQMG